MIPKWLQAWLAPLCVGWVVAVAFQEGWGQSLVTFCAVVYLIGHTWVGYHQSRKDLEDD